MEIEIKGHSGCSIDLRREDRNLIIYKSSCDPKYLPRLIKQAYKQKIASEKRYSHFKVPGILAIETTDSSVQIKMPYIFSKNYMEFFECAGFEQIDLFTGELISFIEEEIKECELSDFSSEDFMLKFNDVVSKISANSNLNEFRESINLLLEKSAALLKAIDLFKIPVGTCHGDMTFSNILFNGNNFYLIDFLDSFVESPLMDIVKIRQDSRYLWSNLMYGKDFDYVRLRMIASKIDAEIDSFFNRYQWYRDYYYPFQLLNFLRILQYAKEQKVIEFLTQSISQILTDYESDYTDR